MPHSLISILNDIIEAVCKECVYCRQRYAVSWRNSGLLRDEGLRKVTANVAHVQGLVLYSYTDICTVGTDY